MEKLLGGESGFSGQDSGSELEGLREKHQELEKRLAVLERHVSLTTAEQAERARLKKEKLQVKDRMLVLTASRPH
jgi:uncharacterized protein YdcH (DUF465 family)